MANRKHISKVSEKLTKVNDTFTVYMFDNGYMVEIGGRTADEDFSAAKIMCSSMEQLIEVISDIAEMDHAG